MELDTLLNYLKIYTKKGGNPFLMGFATLII